MSTQLVEATAFKAMQTDIQISMDDVVSAFVSQYENNLYARKKELSKEIKVQESTIEDMAKTVRMKNPSSNFVEPMPYGLKLTIDNGTIDWDEAKIRYQLKIQSPAPERSYSSGITVVREKKISAAQIAAYNKTQEKLKELRAELNEVLVNLKSVNRKERQVRGRIAIRKLEDSGYANLMEDAELVKLVQLDD